MYVALDQRDCVTCDPVGYCNCASDEICSSTQQTCTQCATLVCTKKSSTTNKGAIAGGVVGGFVALAILVAAYFWWRRRHARRAAAFLEQQQMMDESEKYSIHSVNTAQARGSNVIPIAYIPGVSEQRGSVATSDYRASLPDFVMAVHGQPSLVEIGNKMGPDQQRSSLYDGLGLDELAGLTDTTEAGANSGKSMVTIPEEDESTCIAHRAVTGVPTMRTYDPRVIDAPPVVDPRKTSRNSQYPNRQSNSTRYSRNSSVREYNMNIPEEALFYYNNLDERDVRDE